MLITNRKLHTGIRLVPKSLQRPNCQLDNFEWPYAACRKMHLSEPITKISMKIGPKMYLWDSIYFFSGNTRFTRSFAGYVVFLVTGKKVSMSAARRCLAHVITYGCQLFFAINKRTSAVKRAKYVFYSTRGVGDLALLTVIVMTLNTRNNLSIFSFVFCLIFSQLNRLTKVTNLLRYCYLFSEKWSPRSSSFSRLECDSLVSTYEPVGYCMGKCLSNVQWLTKFFHWHRINLQ